MVSLTFITRGSCAKKVSSNVPLLLPSSLLPSPPTTTTTTTTTLHSCILILSTNRIACSLPPWLFFCDALSGGPPSAGALEASATLLEQHMASDVMSLYHCSWTNPENSVIGDAAMVHGSELLRSVKCSCVCVQHVFNLYCDKEPVRSGPVFFSQGLLGGGGNSPPNSNKFCFFFLDVFHISRKKILVRS